MDTPIISDTELLEQIEAFCTRNDVSLTTFGRKAVGDGNLVSNLRAGRSLTLKTANRVIEFMREYRPVTEPARAAAA